MKVLVTGATGFVGTWLTKKLLDQGLDVRVLTRSGKAEFPFDSTKVEVFPGDITNKNSVIAATVGMETVFHLAGLVGYSRAMRDDMQKINVDGTANVIEACLQSQCDKLIHMSSVAAVGASFDEKNILNENSTYNLHRLNLGYFETKWQAEQLVLGAVHKSNLNAVIVNPSTIYGAGDAKKGSRKTQVKVARGNFPFYTSGGVNVIHIQDVVDAIYRASEVGRKGERYILCGENIKIKTLFDYIAKAAGQKPPPIYLPNSVVFSLGAIGDLMEKCGRKGFITTENAWTSTLYHWFDNTKAKNELGLSPRSAYAAIEESVFWMKRNIF